MGIFDKLRGAAASAINSATNTTAYSIGNKTETFTFQKLPESLAELQAMPEASLDSPFKTAALSLCALCAYGADKAIGIEMLNFLKGPKPLSPAEISFLDDRFRDGQWYVPFTYFKGATPENNYTPTEPFTVEISSNPHSAVNEGYMTLWLKSDNNKAKGDVDLVYLNNPDVRETPLGYQKAFDINGIKRGEWCEYSVKFIAAAPYVMIRMPNISDVYIEDVGVQHTGVTGQPAVLKEMNNNSSVIIIICIALGIISAAVVVLVVLKRNKKG